MGSAFTGFGLFVGLLRPVLFGAEWFHSRGDAHRRRARHDLHACNVETGFPIHPAEDAQMQGKLDFLEERRLDLFRRQ